MEADNPQDLNSPRHRSPNFTSKSTKNIRRRYKAYKIRCKRDGKRPLSLKEYVASKEGTDYSSVTRAERRMRDEAKQVDRPSPKKAPKRKSDVVNLEEVRVLHNTILDRSKCAITLRALYATYRSAKLQEHQSRQVPAQPDNEQEHKQAPRDGQSHPDSQDEAKAFRFPSFSTFYRLIKANMASDNPLFVCVKNVRGEGPAGGGGPAGGSGPVRSSIPAIDSAPQDPLSDEDESEDSNSKSDAPPVPPAKRKSKKRGPNKRRPRPAYYGFHHD